MIGQLMEMATVGRAAQWIVRAGVLSGVALTAAACGGNDEPDSAITQPPASTFYEGVVTSGVTRGLVTLRSGSPATGTISVGDDAPVSLTGTSISGQFLLSGGGFTIAASPQANDVLLGSASGGALQTSATLAAIQSVGRLERYCGVYTGTDAGMVSVAIQDNQAIAAVQGMGASFAMSGTASGTSVNFLFTRTETGTNRPSTITANLQLQDGVLKGTASNSLYPGGGVTVTGTREGCGGRVVPPVLEVFAGAITAPSRILHVWLTVMGNGYPMQATSGFIGDSVTGRIPVQGTYNRPTRVLTFSGSGITASARVADNLKTFTGTVTGTGTLGSQLNGYSIDGLTGDAASPPKLHCGSMEGTMKGPIVVVVHDENLSAFVRYDLMPRRLGGWAGKGWLYFNDNLHTFWAATETSSSPTPVFDGTWSSDIPLIGTWQVRSCPPALTPP
jgi:hypothetical protein